MKDGVLFLNNLIDYFQANPTALWFVLTMISPFFIVLVFGPRLQNRAVDLRMQPMIGAFERARRKQEYAKMVAGIREFGLDDLAETVVVKDDAALEAERKKREDFISGLFMATSMEEMQEMVAEGWHEVVAH